jgi:hypothetical protein
LSSLQQNWRRGQNSFCLESREAGREIAQIMYAPINKWISNEKVNKLSKFKNSSKIYTS